MSDSDSVSDSDVNQGWTFVGPEGTVDSSDHDSDIVVLKDDEIQIQNFREVDSAEVKTVAGFQLDESQSEARVKNHEADLESKAEFCEADFRQKTSSASLDVESEAPEAGLIVDERIGVLLPPEEAETLKMSTEENRESSSGEIESFVKGLDAENCMEMGCVENAARRQSDDKGSLLNEHLNTAGEIAESVNQWELADLEELRADSLLNCSLQASSCLQSGFMASTLEGKTDVYGNVCSNSKSKEEDFSEGDMNADDDDGDDDDDEEDEDDDESVVRKFHEATLGSFNRNPLHADDRNESQQIIEDEFLPPDIDDRCESDISGIADDSDSDLSSLAGIDDIPLHAGDVVRTYRHQPNPKFNKCLTFIAATAMLLAIGIGIGHFIGSTRESSVHQRQLLHLKMLQDEYFVCLRDIEKLESKFVKARDSDTQEKITAVTAVWKKKYEELVLERAELEYKLNQMQDRVKAMLLLKEKSEEYARKIEDMTEEELSSKLTGQKPEIAEPSRTLYGNDLENKVESNLKPEGLEQEFKGKLLSTNVTHRPDGPASSVPGNVSETHTPISAEETVTECHKQVDGLKIIVEKKNFEIDLLRNNANQLTVENADLKTAIQSQRYKEHPGNLNSIASEEKVAKVKQADQNMAGVVSYGKKKQQAATGYSERHHVDKPNSQFKILNSNQGEKKESVDMPEWRQSTISLLKFFTAQSLFDSGSASFNNDSINNLTACFTALRNISTGDRSLFDFVSSQAFNKEDVVKQIDVLKYKMKKILSLCQNSVNYENSVNEGQIKFNKFLKVSMSQQENETLQYHAKFVQKFMKQLRSVVQGFVRSIDSFPKAATAKGDKHKMKTEMKNWAYRMKSSWKKMEEAVSLIKNQKQHRGYTWKEPWQMSNVREAEVHSSVLRPVGEKSNQAFDGNRDHKQTESSSSHQRYEEFWRWNHFDPDDFLQEGFFEDNQREWHKHQKRLRKINGRIQRLTEEILLSMDDDDIEDIYEDIDDFADDVEDREIPEQLRTWLSCQTRWWRSRVHRKHRNEDLVKGCGQQLMHWQLRVLCKEKSGKQLWNQERYSYDRFCKAVISSQGQGLNSRYFVMDTSLFRQGAKEDEWKHFSSKKHDVKRFTVDHLINLSGEYKVENITFTDHSAYNCDSVSRKHHHQPDLPVKSRYFANGRSFPQHVHLAHNHAATGHEPQYDQSMNCLEESSFCKRVRDDKQWCEK